MSYHQSACRMKKMTTPASNAQSAIRSNVESKKAPNWVPPVVSFAIEPSRESASTSNVSTTAPAKSHPVIPVTKATTMVPIVPMTVTVFAVKPMDINALASGSMSFLNGARRCSSTRIPVPRKRKGRASVNMMLVRPYMTHNLIRPNARESAQSAMAALKSSTLLT